MTREGIDSAWAVKEKNCVHHRKAGDLTGWGLVSTLGVVSLGRTHRSLNAPSMLYFKWSVTSGQRNSGNAMEPGHSFSHPPIEDSHTKARVRVSI